MRKRIKIFLGSSIVELELERLKIENFIYRISREFEKNYDVSIDPVMCEIMDDAYSYYGKQAIINEAVRECDLCFFIFFNRVGKYTLEEFYEATQCFNRTGRPKVYVYFKETEEADEGLICFRQSLSEEFRHYYGTFEHIDTVIMRILMKLQLHELDICEISFEGNDCLVDGKKAMSLDNVAEFANNKRLCQLNDELRQVEELYLSMKKGYLTDDRTPEKRKEYEALTARRKELLRAVAELRGSILEMSLRMCSDEESGCLTPLQKEAYRLFESGDIERAKKLFNYEEMKDRLNSDVALMDAGIEVLREDKVNRIRQHILESRTYIGLLAMDKEDKSGFDNIEGIYSEITERAFSIKAEHDVIIDFAWFLLARGKGEEAYTTARKCWEYFAFRVDDKSRARMSHVLGVICSGLEKKQEAAESYFLEAVRIRDELARENPEAFNMLLSRSCYELAELYARQPDRQDEAETYYLRVVEIRERLSEAVFEKNAPALADSCLSFGRFYYNWGRPESAEKYISRAVQLYEDLYRADSGRYIVPLAYAYNEFIVLYETYSLRELRHNASKEREYIRRAIEINHILAAEYPADYEAQLATYYISEAVYYHQSMSFEYGLRLAARHPDNEACRKMVFRKIKRGLHLSVYKEASGAMLDYAKAHPEIPDCREIIEATQGKC